MSTSILPWVEQAKPDSPWRRLHWTLPLALLICSATFILFAYSMWRPVIHTSDPTPVTAELIELPAPAQAQPQVRQKTIVQPHIEPAVQQEQPSAITPPPSPTVPPVTAPPPGKPVAMNENRGAQALIQPLPTIPDELREEAMNETATASFQIAADGSATVVLVKPTQNPRLNRLLLDTLKNWKFIPAIKEGQPVPSVEVMIIRMHVN
ncbi:MAG: energy transducer TonB [Gallionella sp.]